MFGDFELLCKHAPLPLCQLLGSDGLQPTCYARSVEVANTIIFQAATGFIHIVALIMTIIMILHIRSKYTAVGRKEILTLFYLFFLLTAISLCIDTGVVPPESAPYSYFVAVQVGLSCGTCWSLLVNAFVGFQIYEDGTKLSLWLLRLSALFIFLVSGVIGICTFKSWGPFSPTNTVGLFIVLYIFNALCLAVYALLQTVLVVFTLQERWPLGHLLSGIFFLATGQVLLYIFSPQICNGAQHYVDALFFATTCNLLAVMMVYKYWDSITKEDLEFSVGMKSNNWDIKEIEDQSYYPLAPNSASRQSFGLYQDSGRIGKA